MQISGAISDVLVVVPSTSCYRSPDIKNFHCFSDSKSAFLSSKTCSSFYIGKPAAGLDKSKSRGFMIRCCGQSRENLAPIAPLQLESPTGQLLTQILQTHPHLLPAAIDQQLENLQNDRDAQKAETPSSSQDLLLYRRIAEVREKERHKAVEEILYCLIVQRFAENNIAMIPKISPSSDSTGRVDFWPNQEQKLESVHSPEAFEMIQSHLSLVLGERLVGPLQTMIEISKVKLGKLYAASIMYGYFLRRVDQRYQLERAMKTLPKDLGRNTTGFQGPIPESPFWDPDSLIQIPADEDDMVSYSEGESYKLRSYVMYLDAETLQRYATIRSREAMSLIEKQTQALFGRPDIRVTLGGALEAQNDAIVSITFAGLTMLVLEAVAFGSFLWDAEDHVESKYSFLNS
uniref:UV-B-induced protein At3g17800, chloroplastic-like n=2 Tax=Opuntia streptacantha TaxID=393608 RepID=A0A7C8Z4I6_OPUST